MRKTAGVGLASEMLVGIAATVTFPDLSSSMMVYVWVLIASSTALTGLLNEIRMVSFVSTRVSLTIVRRIDWLFVPGRKVSVPAASV